MDNQNIGKRLKELRGSLKLNQNKFSEILDVNQSYISAIERGKKEPTMKLTLSIAEKMKIPKEYLINYLYSENSSIDDISEYLSGFLSGNIRENDSFLQERKESGLNEDKVAIGDIFLINLAKRYFRKKKEIDVTYMSLDLFYSSLVALSFEIEGILKKWNHKIGEINKELSDNQRNKEEVFAELDDFYNKDILPAIKNNLRLNDIQSLAEDVDEFKSFFLKLNDSQ